MVSPRAVLHAALLIALILLGSVVEGLAQGLAAKITRVGNPVPDEGTITGVHGDSIMLALPNGGSLSVPLAQVTKVEAAPPPACVSGLTAYNAGNYDKALADLQPIGDQFRGLPTDWAQATLLTLGNIYLEKTDAAKAEAAFSDYKRLYPRAANSLPVTVAQARIALARNNVAQARPQLEAIIQAALKAPAEITRGESVAYGQVFFLMAKLQERDSQYQDALQNYLRVVTLFYEDPALVGRAQKSADDLRAARKNVTAP